VDATIAGAWMSAMGCLVERNKDHLTALDAAIGDADHGTNLARGFAAVRTALDAKEPKTPGEVLVIAGGTLISKVGGASGPLYGSALRSAGKCLGDELDASPTRVAQALRDALAAVKRLGAAEPGDKTMVDALTPAVDAFDAALAGDGDLGSAARSAAQAAERGAEATIELQALKGRASYLGPRSVGHQDPGATSTVLLFQALAEACEA
jgi:dihydroxyacetone kinase-like protein